jgi:PucR C-terminal helix-turn-helix domain/GGDEF-like domain
VLEDIQQIVDEVAIDLGRPVVVEDERHSLIAHSAHAHSDPVRQKALLLRQTPPEAIAWVTSVGLLDAEGPIRIPANPQLKAASRVCTPIRDSGRVVGFLSVLDPDEALDADGLSRCAEASQALAPALHDLRLAQQVSFPRERELVESLILGSDSTERARSGSELTEAGRLSPPPLAAFIVKPTGDLTGADSNIEGALEQIVRRQRHAFPARSLVAVTRSDHAVLVVALQALGTTSASDVALRVRDAVAPLLKSGTLGAWPVIAFGDAAASAEDVAASYRQATAAARVDAAIGAGDGAPLGWAEIGAYQALVHIPEGDLGRGAMDERILRLAGKPELMTTLETYLGLAGDAKRATAELALHRASLYYRLTKIEELAEIDLKSGRDRLEAHLAIMALRLAGRLPESP